MAESHTTISSDRKQDRIGVGILAVEIGVVTFVLQDMIMKFLGADMSVWQLQVIRSSVGIIPFVIGAYFFVGKSAFVIHNWWLHLFRGSAGFTGYTAFYIALVHMPVGQAGALFYTGPIMITILSAFFLKEKLGIYRVGAVLTGFAGILFILRPGTDDFSLISFLPLYCAFIYAVCMIVVRRYGHTESTIGLAIYVNVSYLVYASIGSLLALWFFSDATVDDTFFPILRPWIALDYNNWLLYLCLGIAGFSGHLFMTMAYKSAPASIIAPFDYTYVALIALGGFFFFDEVPDAYSILGMAMIVGSGLFIGYRETVRARKETRQKLTATRISLPSTLPHTKRPNEERAPSDQLPS